MPTFAQVTLLHVSGLVVAAGLEAQQPVARPAVVVAVDDVALEERLQIACAALHAGGRLVGTGALQLQIGTAKPSAGAVVPLRTTAVPAPDLHDLVQPSTRLVVHYYRCKECDDWHVTTATGFCVDAEGRVATCAHVVAPDEGMRESFLATADLHGNVWPVEAVTAASVANDVCVLQTAERGAVPLPLRPAVRTGERVWCLSHPDHQFGFFSEGLVARQYLLREVLPDREPPAKEGEPGKPRYAPPVPFLHVTCDFCKGSSGAPIVDAMGNVVGIAQSTTTVVYDEAATPVDTQMVFKSATPAAALLELVRASGPAAK